MSSKTGKAVGITSLAVPLIGAAINDLYRPDSIIRKLAGRTIDRFLETTRKSAKMIDITDEVEIYDTDKRTVNIVKER